MGQERDSSRIRGILPFPCPSYGEVGAATESSVKLGEISGDSVLTFLISISMIWRTAPGFLSQYPGFGSLGVLDLSVQYAMIWRNKSR